MMLKDMDQARKMVNVRIKIDVWSQGVEESIREEIRENLRDLFCQLPPRRVWYYLKRIRHLQLKGSINNESSGTSLQIKNLVDGPEDVIANRTFHQPYRSSFLLLEMLTWI